MSAKNNASEKALRDIIIQRMIQSPKASALKITNDPQQQSHSGKLLYTVYSVLHIACALFHFLFIFLLLFHVFNTLDHKFLFLFGPLNSMND